MLCDLEYLEKLIEGDDKLRELVQFWHNQSLCLRSIDKAAAEAAVTIIYRRLKIPVPEVRWWLSPIAMILAHDTFAFGLRWVERNHGRAVMQSSPEYLCWLESGVDKRYLGKPIGERACACCKCTQSALDFHQQHFMVELGRMRLETIDMLVDNYPSFRAGDAVRDALESALSGMLESNKTVLDRTMFRKTASVFERSCFWAQARCHDFLRADLKEHLASGSPWHLADESACSFASGSPWRSCMHGYGALAQHCHVALLRDGLCWLCADPQSMRLGADVDPTDPLDLAMVRYQDGTHLFSVQGTAMPDDAFWRPHALGMLAIDGPDANYWRREALVRRYGVKRYLEELNARVIDTGRNESTGVDHKLWRVTLANQSVVTFLESSCVDLMDTKVFDYRELPGTIATIGQAEILEDSDSLDCIRFVTIFNQRR